MKTLYFDYAATTPVSKEVLQEMIPYFELQYGNASAMYEIGRQSKRAIELARKRVASAINARPKEIYFTSCGSESDNLAIKGIAYGNRKKGNHIITTRIEHPAVLKTCEFLEKQGYHITYLSPNSNGIVSVKELERYIRENYRGFYGALKTICKENEINNGVVDIVPFSVGTVCFQDFCKFNPVAANNVVRKLLNRSFATATGFKARFKFLKG